MQKLFSCLLIALFTFGLVVTEANAKRFGSGRSFGVQRSQSSLFSPKQHSSATTPPRSNTNRWGGMLGGLLVGGLLASLFMGNGFASGLMSWLLVGGVILVLLNLWRRRTQPSFQGNSNNNGQFFNNNFSNQYSANTSAQSFGGSSSSAYPAGFSAEEFLRDAKVKFIRMQAAFDQKNLQDLRDFTAPEVFAEVKMQLDEIGSAPNKTEVLRLEAELLDVADQVDSSIASVRFTGSIKENDDAPMPLDEIWHFRQFSPKGEWVVGGIQQQ